MAKKKHLTIASPGIQYLIGLLINFLCLSILLSNSITYFNIQLPEKDYSENLWKGSDVLSYVRPAQNFIDHRVFGDGNVPDYHRTIGYPLFLSILMMVFGSHWLIFTFFVQAVIFALMYPLLSRISKIFFNAGNIAVIFTFLFFIISGTYTVWTPIILTDTLFTVFFTLGLWSGLESILRRSYAYLFLHIIFIGYAAQVRPLLSIYPIMNCFILSYTAMRHNLAKRTRVYQTIFISFVLLLIVCNLSSIRNYINYNFARPTDTFSNDMLNLLGRDVLREVGKNDEYEQIQKMLQGIDDMNVKADLQEKFAIKIYKDYPWITLKRMMRNAVGVLGRAPWPVMAYFWGYSFKDTFDSGHMPLKRSMAVYLIECFFNIIYLCIYLLFLGFLVRNFRLGNITFVLAIVFFIAYFLIPTFIAPGGGSRYRLPVEGLIVIMASCELEHYFKAFSRRGTQPSNERMSL